ncbi:hypothetical protein NKI72_33160 [Mesorhizobium sp. M0437]
MRGDNPYRIKAYLRAADSLTALSQPLDRIIAAGALTKIPGIGDAPAARRLFSAAVAASCSRQTVTRSRSSTSSTCCGSNT